MNTFNSRLLAMAALLLVSGCAVEEATPPKKAGGPKAVPVANAAETKKLPIGKNVFLEMQGQDRRVLIESTVCLRQGGLEQLLTRKNTKEHEAILVADIDAQNVHAALLAAGAERGSPVKFQPKYLPPHGQPIKVTLEYTDPVKKERVRVRAQEWILDAKDGKQLKHDWVFAGSVDFPDPQDPRKRPFYAANQGDVICVANMDTALLDLPINSSKDAEALAFDANTNRIPPEGTPVLVILEPLPPKKK